MIEGSVNMKEKIEVAKKKTNPEGVAARKKARRYTLDEKLKACACVSKKGSACSISVVRWYGCQLFCITGSVGSAVGEAGLKWRAAPREPKMPVPSTEKIIGS